MLGNTIGAYRRKKGLTQEQLAKLLDVTNQAVSKWETDQCCPDVQLLPKLADVLEISLDVLFGRDVPKMQTGETDLPWEDDESLHIVVYQGHELLTTAPAGGEMTIVLEGDAIRDVYCAVNLRCDDVAGNVEAGGFVECADVAGHVSAGSYVECDDVAGNLSSASYVECGDVEGSVNAMSYVECGDVGGSVTSMSYVDCDSEGDGEDDDSSDSGFTFTFRPFGKK